MFTGIIQQTGKIIKIEDKNNQFYLTIKTKKIFKNLKIGDSIACDGVCLTVIKKINTTFKVELMPETLGLTSFKNIKVNSIINLEPALKLNDYIGGHLVSGHVDGIGAIKKINKNQEYIDLIIQVPKKLIKYLAYKGSAAINGASLTISGVGEDWFKVSLISHTLAVTNLKYLKEKDQVNIEVDLIARYLEQLIKDRPSLD